MSELIALNQLKGNEALFQFIKRHFTQNINKNILTLLQCLITPFRQLVTNYTYICHFIQDTNVLFTTHTQKKSQNLKTNKHSLSKQTYLLLGVRFGTSAYPSHVQGSMSSWKHCGVKSVFCQRADTASVESHNILWQAVEELWSPENRNLTQRNKQHIP